MSSRAPILFVLPNTSGRSAVIDAQLLAAASLARAVGAQCGGAEILSSVGLLDPDEVEARAVRGSQEPSAARAVARRIPRSARLALADAHAYIRARRTRALAELVDGRSYRLVIQMHRRFRDVGFLIAKRIGVPLVLRVEAMEVREEASWGLPRPLLGDFIERIGELRLIRKADLVASVSTLVDAQLADAGIDERRRIVLHNGVDLAMFSPRPPDETLRRQHGLSGRFTIGWIGGFRPFHGLQDVPEIAKLIKLRVPTTTICLLGTGPLRDQMSHELKGLEDTVRLLPPVQHSEVPRWLNLFDVCLLLGESSAFHYSPLKLYEYLGCGRPIVAADVGEVTEVLRNEKNGLLFPSGDAEAAASALERIYRNPRLRDELGRSARLSAESSASWDARATALLDSLSDRGLLGASR